MATTRELARRAGGGIDVTLYWDAADNTTSIEVFHDATETLLHFAVPRGHALDAFYHPFAHLPSALSSHEAVTVQL
jgi:YD repeat-containing protein